MDFTEDFVGIVEIEVGSQLLWFCIGCVWSREGNGARVSGFDDDDCAEAGISEELRRRGDTRTKDDCPVSEKSLLELGSQIRTVADIEQPRSCMFVF